MPAESDIAREIGRDIDPDAIFRARTALRIEIGQQFRTPLAAIYDRMAQPGGYSPDAKSAGRRALRNVALDLLAVTGKPDEFARAYRQYQSADNMTDRVAALATLALYGAPEGRGALADFYKRYESDALVIDKWFALQATIPQRETLDAVRELTRHPAFSLANPNRVRSLIGAFAQGNPTQFNRIDGLGYDFIADIVLALDPKNPQISARLATAFRTWRTLEKARRDKAEAALTRMKATPGLSRDLADILERALAPA
jgi:aminopeptidase N